MTAPKALVITGNGTNCERETANACMLAGAEATIAHTSDLLGGDVKLSDYHFLNLPGGFLDGDDLGSAKAAAVRFKFARIADTERRFLDELLEFIDRGGLVLGVCNGFQLMVKLGLLPGNMDGGTGNRVEQVASVTHNDSGKFEDRWVHLEVNSDSPCVFTKGIERIYLPVRHGEGKFIPRDSEVLETIKKANLAPVRYATAEGGATMEYPQNPNGSVDAIAGICDETGRLFGLMPHPEAYVHPTNHPRWTRDEGGETTLGLSLYINAVDYLKQSIG